MGKSISLSPALKAVCRFPIAAVIFQHECDHLHGILYTDKTAD